MEDGARLEDLSFLPAGARVPAGETWEGSPARRFANSAVHTPPPAPLRGAFQRAVTGLIYAGLVLAVPIILMAAFVPGIVVLMRIDLLAHPLLYLASAPFVGGTFVLLLCLEVVVFKWLLVGRTRAGTYPVHGSFYVRNWMVNRLLVLALDVIAPIHATLYAAPWYRALGAKLGRLVELSTVSATPDLLSISDGGTVADEVSLGAPTVICEVLGDKGDLREYRVTPEDVGLARQNRDAVRGGDAAFNAGLLRETLAGKLTDAHADMVSLNAGVALLACERVQTLEEGVKLAQDTLRSGRAVQTLDAAAALSQQA